MPAEDIAVSVAIPTYGRLALLNRCLDALTRQTLSSLLYEIIVVDDGPSRTTGDAIAAWSVTANRPAIRCSTLLCTRNIRCFIDKGFAS